ncbi:MAG: hypothetical protein OEY41_11410 [Acidimicrobiia bacterium]|nr:hypothetical protein [Acidimicrobiia bacterium]MDH5290594.1 hypothetical protein [Acidimicrobiia bacterium]
MTDLDIQIDVPDDDGLNSPVRVLGGNNWLPPWFKAVVVILLGTLATIMLGAYLLGRSRAASNGDEGATDPSVSTTIGSAASSPTIDASLAAVLAWEGFARSGDLDTIRPWFDEAGPQFALFAQSATAGTPGADDITFEPRNPVETEADGLTTVSMELAVTGPQGQDVYLYDFVYRGESLKVWTVVDRRAPGTVALPPPQAVVDSATRNWDRFTSALAIGDAKGASTVVSEPTRVLVDQLTAAARTGGGAPADGPITDPSLFEQLVSRVKAADAASPDNALLALLNADQRRALVTGKLASWTQVDADRVVASLIVDGKPTAIVPFRATAEGWMFDLVEALETSNGGTS